MQAVEQHVVGRERVGLARSQLRERLRVVGATVSVMSSLNRAARSRIVFSLVVPAVTTTVLPARSRNDLIGEPFFTSSLVPETKIIGEKPTSFWRSRLLVVDPHSRSTWPEDDRVDARLGGHRQPLDREVAADRLADRLDDSLRQSSIE